MKTVGMVSPSAFAWPIIGNERAVRILQRFVTESNGHHAILLVGPPHVGKATVARIVGQTILCRSDAQSAGPPYPCWSCPSCTATTARETSLTVLERDEAKNVIPIDVIRTLQQTLRLRPFLASPKVILIIGADLLTEEAANALLKLLEEPPGATRFLLTADALATVPATIVSRCFSLSLTPVPHKTLARALVARGAPEETALLFAELAQGLPGKALALLQLPSGQETALTAIRTFAKILTASPLDQGTFVSTLFPQQEMTATARERCLKEIPHWQGVLRTLLHAAVGLPAAAPVLRTLTSQFSRSLSPQQILKGLKRLETVDARVRTNVHPRVALEDFLLSAKA